MNDVDRTTEKLLRHEANLLEQEARMVLPGIQTLFGFQLIVVFNEQFFERLNHDQRIWHVISMALTILAMAFAIAPAAYNRKRVMNTVTHKFVTLANSWLGWTFLPLAFAIAIDFGLIGIMVFESAIIGVVMGSLVFTFLNLLWYAYPDHSHRGQASDLEN